MRKKKGYNVFFVGDTHFSHKNILKYQPKRAEVGGFDVEDVASHDKWLIDVWNKSIRKWDIVYILGDFAFGNSEDIKNKFLSKLNGRKFLILGNHDSGSKNLDGYFEQITQMKEVVFKRKNFPFIEDDDFRVFMCHYPMVTWPGKHFGVVNLHGHCHSNIDVFNEESSDLRVDVGIDGTLAGFKPIPLEELYRYFKKKAKGMSFEEYVKEMMKLQKTQI